MKKPPSNPESGQPPIEYGGGVSVAYADRQEAPTTKQQATEQSIAAFAAIGRGER